MSDAPEPGELDHLRRENEALNEQVKLLVQTEQRLYRSQNELDAQLDRIRALSAFTLDSEFSESPVDIAGRALDVLAQSFSLDWIGVIALEPSPDRIRLLRVQEAPDPGGREIAVAEGDGEWLRGLSGPVSVSGVSPGPTQALWRLLGGLAPELVNPERVPAAGFAACVPVDRVDGQRPGLLLACSVTRRHVFLKSGGMVEQHLPFLQLVAHHLNHAIANTLLTASLRERSAELANSLAKLEKTQQELLQVQKMEAVGRLAGGVAHDFNNLLTVILGYAGSLAGSLAPDAPQQEHVRRVLDAAQRAAGITSQLLALGRRQMQRPEAFDLSRQTAHTLELLRRLVGEHIQIELALDPGLPAVRADRSQIEQVLLNLVVNARDAMPEGGPMRISTRRAGPADAARCEDVLDAGAFAVVEVEDAGVGMDEVTRTRVFEPFFTTKGPGKGTGLGLAVVYGIVKQSGGHVLVDSRLGLGSRFTVLLPFAPAGTPTARGHSDAAASVPLATTAERRVVFVVEDEDAIRDVIAVTLQRAGYSVRTAIHGEDALDQLGRETSAPDLLLTDVIMPRLGGLKLVETLRRRHRELRVGYMSGYSDDLVSPDGRREAGVAFLAKPFTPRELLAFVAERLAADAPARH